MSPRKPTPSDSRNRGQAVDGGNGGLSSRLDNSTLNFLWVSTCVLTLIMGRLLRHIPVPRGDPPADHLALLPMFAGASVVGLLSLLEGRYVFLITMMLTGYVTLRLAFG